MSKAGEQEKELSRSLLSPLHRVSAYDTLLGDGRAEVNMQGRRGLGEFWCRWKAPESGEGVLPPTPQLCALSPPSAPTGGARSPAPAESGFPTASASAPAGEKPLL